MRLNITIIDASTKQPIAGAVVTLRDPVYDKDVSVTANANGQLYFDIPDDYLWSYGVTSVTATVVKEGYAVLIITQRLGLVGETISRTWELSKGTNVSPWLIAAALAAIYVYRRNNKKVGALTSDDVKTIMLATGGIIGFTLIKQLLESLGIWQDADGAALDNATNNPNSFWSPIFWQNKPTYTPWTYTINEAQAIGILQQIQDCFSFYNDNEERAIGIFKTLRTQSNLSYLAYVFADQGKGDLLTYLRGGNWPQDRLSDADVQVINQYISRLPKY